MEQVNQRVTLSLCYALLLSWSTRVASTFGSMGSYKVLVGRAKMSLGAVRVCGSLPRGIAAETSSLGWGTTGVRVSPAFAGVA